MDFILWTAETFSITNLSTLTLELNTQLHQLFQVLYYIVASHAHILLKKQQQSQQPNSSPPSQQQQQLQPLLTHDSDHNKSTVHAKKIIKVVTSLVLDVFNTEIRHNKDNTRARNLIR